MIEIARWLGRKPIGRLPSKNADIIFKVSDDFHRMVGSSASASMALAFVSMLFKLRLDPEVWSAPTMSWVGMARY